MTSVALAFALGCGGQHGGQHSGQRDGQRDGQRGGDQLDSAPSSSADASRGPTLYVRIEGEVSDIQIRTEQYFRVASQTEGKLELTASRARATLPYHPVRLPPRFEAPEREQVELVAPTAAEWSDRVEQVTKSPGSLAAWTNLLRATGASLSSGELRQAWEQVAADLSIGNDQPPKITSEKTPRGVNITFEANLEIRQESVEGMLAPQPMTGTLQAHLELDRAHPIRTRGWAHLDLREPDRELAWGEGEPHVIHGERLSLVFAMCFDEHGAASFEARCFPDDTPALGEAKPQEAAKAYVGEACAPRVAQLQETMKLFPWEAYVYEPSYPLPESKHGRPLTGGWLELDVTDELVVPYSRDTPFAAQLKLERLRRRDSNRPGIGYALRLPAHLAVAKGMHQLVAALQPEDEVILIVEDPRPRKREFVPPGATAWLTREVSEILALSDVSKAAERKARLGSAIGLCTPLIKMFGELAGMPKGRAAYMDDAIPRGLLSCGCEGVDLDAIDAYRRLVAVSHPGHRYLEIPLPLTKRANAPVIRFPETTSGQALVDRVVALSPEERQGFRIVFEGRSWKEHHWR